MGDALKKPERRGTPLDQARKFAAAGWRAGELDHSAERIVQCHEYLGTRSDLPNDIVEGLLGVKSAWQNLERELKRLRENLGVEADEE